MVTEFNRSDRTELLTRRIEGNSGTSRPLLDRNLPHLVTHVHFSCFGGLAISLEIQVLREGNFLYARRRCPAVYAAIGTTPDSLQRVMPATLRPRWVIFRRQLSVNRCIGTTRQAWCIPNSSAPYNSDGITAPRN